jgi:hypothetical protein
VIGADTEKAPTGAVRPKAEHIAEGSREHRQDTTGWLGSEVKSQHRYPFPVVMQHADCSASNNADDEVVATPVEGPA